MHIAHVGISIVHIGKCGRWIFFITAYVPDKEYFFFASEFVYTILLYVAISYYYVSILWLPLNDGFKL